MRASLCRESVVSLAPLLATSMVMLFAPVARAQNSNTGEIKGSVMDPTGAVVPEASVLIKNVQTGVVTTATTNAAGLYDVPFLAPGSYTVTFSKRVSQFCPPRHCSPDRNPAS